MTATASSWSLVSETIDIERGCLVGILNATPDSFSDAGEFLDAEAAVAHGLTMTELGASVVDVGGESTRPGAEPVSGDVELSRVMPVISGLAARGVRVSIDTQKSAVAEEALDAGAVIVNDVGGFVDEAMVDLVAGRRCGAMIMHKRGTAAERYSDTRYHDVVGEVEDFLLDRAQHLVDVGVDRVRIAIDPGIGFGKDLDHNLELMHGVDALLDLGRPVLVGPSRKRFIGAILDLPEDERVEGTIGAVVWMVGRGAHIVRVHDVREVVRAVRVADAIARAG